MAETSPGDNDYYEGPATNTDSSPDSQPSSLHTNDGSFEKAITSHPLAEMFQCVKGLEFRIRGTQEKCPSFTYASLPGVSPAPLEWKVCCEPDQEVGGEYVTYHKLTDSDDSLSAVMANYGEPNIAGLIIINTSNSTTLSSDFINKEDKPTTPPVYIISLEDGDKLITFVSTRDEGAVQVKVHVESTVDTVSTPGMSAGLHLPLSNKSDSQSKLDLYSPFNLHEELKKILFVHKKEKLHICANQVQFQFLISCFHNYEAQTRRDSQDKAIKMLGHFTEDNFKKDFLFYLLLAHRFLVYHVMYGDSNTVNNYVKMCIEKFEAMNDVQAMANVILTFIECGDFTVQFNHGPKSDASVFQLLYHTASVMLKKSNKLHTKTHKINIYSRILWIALVIYFGLQVDIAASLLTPLWGTDLLSDQVQRELVFSDDIIKEFARGFELLSALGLPEGVYFLPSELAIFLNPLKMKTLHISHLTKLLNAGQRYLNWNLISLCHILPPIRSNYEMFFNTIKVGWTRYSKDGTKIGVYKESLMFLECIYDWIPESSQNDEDDKWADVAKSHIEKWIELLVDHLDICAHDAMEYVKLLRSQKKHRKFITSKIQTKGMQVVADLTMSHFSTLFSGSLFWRSEFVEVFLNYHNVPKTIDLKNTSWKQLLEEIVTRFPDANCKRCIVGLIGRISKAYKSAGRQNVFVLDLVKMGIPNLLFVKSYKPSDTNVEKLFIDMVSAFIQRSGLRESTLEQIPAIMKLVEPDNHLQSLILTVIQKEVVPDSKMLEKLYLTDHLKLVIHESVTAACNSLTTSSQLSEADKFYWHFIASCCNHVQPNRENLAKLNTYLFPIEKLSIIFHEYCTENNIEKSVIHSIPQEISHISNADVKNYFSWIVKMQEIMIHWHSKLIERDFNYDDTFTYAGKLQSIAAFAKAVCTEHLVYTADEITKLKDDYSALYAELCLLLVKNDKEYGWCTLIEMLSCYGIKFSHTLQTKLETHLVLPEGGPVVTTDAVQQILNQPNGQLELEPEMILRLKKSVTWRILQEILRDLKVFLKPIMSHLEFLVYFHLHNCEMFSKHLKSQMAKLTVNSEEPVEESAIKLILTSVGETQSCTSHDEKLLQFATALQSTKDFILSLIKGTAKYAEIFTKGLLEEELIQKFDTESEFKIMCAFPEFQEISAANEEGKEGIKHMLELFQYSKQISVIPEVCSQYQLYQCLQDPKLNELMNIVNSVKTAEDKDKVTGKMANDHMKKIWEVLKFDDTSIAKNTSIAKKCLKIFPAVANCAEFYQFIQNKGFANDTNAFRSQVELITAQLQHEDYNETVLNHLMPAFQYICPFLYKEQSLGDLMNKIIKLYHDGIGFGGDSRRDFCQLETVNSNIIMIQLWFSRTEGDTLENISTELDCIMNSGHFKLVIKPKRITSTSKMDHEAMVEHKSEVLLNYEPTMESYLQKRRLQHLSESHDDTSSTAHVERQFSSVSETWNNEQIDDFVRKLGFLEAQSTEVEQKVKLFQQLSQTAQKFYYTLLKLRDLGHPEYMETTEIIVCSYKLESAESKVTKAEEELKNWSATIRNMHSSYDKLLFFSFSKVLSVYKILTAPEFSVDEMIQEVGFLFENDSKAIKKLQTAVKDSASNLESTQSSPNETPVSCVGKYLEKLCSTVSLVEHFLNGRSQPSTPVKKNSLLPFQEVVHFAPHYDNGQLLRLLIEIYNGVPESYEIFQCDENSIEEDLKLFLSRASKFRYHTFTILGVNMLPYRLQEVILQYHSQETEQALKSAIRLNYIEIAGSILHEMPWVVVKEHEANGPDLKWNDAKYICSKCVNKRNVNYDLVLVYGNAGDGKTHYIKRQLHGNQPSLVIAVNESFSPLIAILKLRPLPRNRSCNVFFNFTIVPLIVSTVTEEQMKYEKLMNTLAWFFFRLLVFEYIEDPETGTAFRLPGGQQWKIFIEVPSLSEVNQKNAEQHLEWICNKIPIFRLLGRPVLVKKESPYVIDSSVQLVCKYLQAYKNRHDINRGINRLYVENGPHVKFGDNPNLTDEQCYSLLRDYMPDHVTKNKVLQQLFIKYMERRCIFMEKFPAFYCNSGCGLPFNSKQVTKDKLEEMVKNKMLVKLQDRYYSNTSQLGQVLMETMLKEVSEFCKIDIQQNWATQSHQQLIYGTGTVQLLTLKPEELSEKITKKFEALGIEIPNIKQLGDRKKLDDYLSCALGVPLTKDEKLQDIDEAKYVLTLDYTVKMLNIHERRECGIPVIIEGETGVGKTALINMLSKLWNHALISKWRLVKRRIIHMLQQKSSDTDDSDLQKFFTKLNTDWELNEDEEITDTFEEWLIQLAEVKHTLPEGNAIPMYQSINKWLLDTMKSEIILGLLDVQFEMKDDQHHDKMFIFGNTEISPISHLIKKATLAPSAQATAKLLCTLLNANLIPTFYKLNIHAALSPKKVQEFFIPVVKLAKHLLKIHEEKQIKKMNKPPVVTVFFDEVNTSSCMGLFKEIIIDKTFEGELLPSNIFLVAACNPHRGNSLTLLENKEECKSETWFRGSYYVQRLHPTMRFLMWDYGSLDHEQEAAYIQSKMIMVNEDFNIVQNVVFSELVVKCQNLIRQLAYEQLKCSGIENYEARARAKSCVSQRDIQRVFTFYGWISKAYEMLQIPSTEGVTTATMVLGDMPAAFISKHPMISENLNREEMKQRALLVALGLVYYMRLDSEYRGKFAKELDKMHFAVKFLTAFTQEMDFYTNELSLPPGIAKTEALKENLFATIICTVTKTPLIIVGAPGSSKTLSFNLTISNLKGPESKQKLFRNTKVFRSLDPHCYQCSRRTTSTEIETVFQRAINRQRSHRSCFSKAIHCVVFMDEAGLPEESHESLKVLHFHLDQQEVAFVAITNHILDAAKTNRAISLFRPTASQKDLETLAKGCLCANPESPPTELKEDLATVVKFCSVYYGMKKDSFKKIFGLRDFIHFIHYIRRERKIGITPQLVLQSLERNFNGTKQFEHICSVFLEKVEAKLNDLHKQQRTIVEILQSSLSDKPFVYQPVNKRVSSLSLNDTHNEVRYKLIIDPSEDESITRLLFMFGILKCENTRTYMCSDFLGDGQLQKINTIAAIRHSAVAGHTVIMSQTDDIHESFYDLFNQHFRRIDDPKDGPRYFTNIAIGAHLKPSRVDQNFQCIVVIKESEVKNTPAPFLNRFEKYLLSHNNLLNVVLNALPPCLKVIANVVYDKVKEFYSLLGESSFYGGNKETVCSLLLKILPRPGHEYKMVTQSLVSFDSKVNDAGSSVTTKGFTNKKALMLNGVVKCLHEFGGFCYMESSVEELEHDANCIVSMLANTGSEFAGVAEELESCDVNAISEWIADAMDLLYTEDGPPDADYDTCDDHDTFVKTLGASNGACMVTAVIAQWLVRYTCKKLMQLMAPEATILNRKFVPISYLETYLNFQSHFSIKELIEKQSELLNRCDDDKIATKLICYTRSTPSIHQLPAVFPRTTFYSAEELQKSNDLVEHLICDKVDNLFLCKLSSISSQTAFKLQLQAFKASQQQTIFVLIISMQDTSRLIINHIRIMIEEAEHAKAETKKLYVLLLHFPAMMFYDPCYPSLFLCGWDHYYLDAIDQTNKSVLVDTKEWFRYSCLSSKGASLPTTINESMFQSLLALLNKPESILVIASRILLSIDSNVVSLDSLPDIDVKANYLKKLLFDKKVADVLCYKFKSYWRPSVMGYHLEQAARFSKSRESTLNVSDSVDSIYRSSFFNFIAFMICQMSKSHNLNMLFSDACDNAALDLFLKLLDAYPIPKLSEIKAYNNTWDCRVHTAGRTAYIPQFPFFMEVSSHICNMVEQSMAEINKLDDTLQENSDVVDSRGKEQILTKLYKHFCDKTSTIIKAGDKVGVKYMSAIAIIEMENDEQIWGKYFKDFIHHFLHLSGVSSDDLEHKLVQLTFTDVLKNYSEMKSIAIHCHMYLNQLDLAKVVASLKPLGQLEELKTDKDSLYQGDPEYSLVGTLHTPKSALGSSSISKFVIDSLFAALVNAVYNKDKGSRLCSIQKWFSSYRDMMSVASLKNMFTVTMLTEQLKTQYHLMETISLVLLSFYDITDGAAECACVLACHLCTNRFNEKFQFIGNKPLNLEQIVSAFHAMLESPQFNKTVSIPQVYQHVMEGLFTHFFPDTTTVYSKEDIEFFLSFANEQNKWKAYIEAIYQSENLINTSKFKFYLDRILCKGWSKSGTIARPLTFYKLEIRICIGKTILSHCPETTLTEYIPSYLQQTATDNQSNPLMQQTLMDIYFYTVLEKLQTCQFTPAELVKMITDTEMNMHSKTVTNAEQLLAVVERQALLEALLQAIADNLVIDDKSKMENFDSNNRSKLTIMMKISDQLNDLIKDQSHLDILLMHLMKKHHGPQGVLNLLADKHKKCWEPFNCLRLIKEKLKGSRPPTSHQFPFVVGSPTAEHKFIVMYKDLCKHLHKVESGSSTRETKTFLNSIINSSNNSYDGKSTVRMMIWLCIYYEFYCNKKKCTVLIKFFKQMEGNLGLSEERLHILKCFLDPENMIKMEEVPNPLNPNAEVLEYSKDGIRPKQPPSNAPKTDPIWEFFNPTDAHEDPSDVDLRHALANMIAVVFGLPDHSTHLWYHMFNPGELENSYLTGFMYNKVVKKGTLMYDCGCELNEDGHYGRSDYNSRDSFSLHSWYLLLWCNFGAFCVGLLTQPTALQQLRGRILSDWMSIRDYCMTQLRTVWFHMRTNMSFGDEERSFFIMSSMYKLFKLFQKKAFPFSHGKFAKLDALIDYEKAWHKHVYEFSKDDIIDKLERHSSNSVWTLPVVKNLRTLERHYPHPATENDYMISLVNATEDNNCSYTHLFALNLFTLEQKKLQVGGALLPDLIEFYKWIHTQLSHLMTYERAKQISIGQVINLTAKRYSSEVCDHLTSLFKRINSKHNAYLKVNGGVIGSVTCNRVTKPTDVHYISKDTPLINLISLEDANKNDWLYVVLMDVIENHNAFLNSIYTHATSPDCHYKKYLPDNPLEVHPTEVTCQTCIVPSDESEGKRFLKLINSHYVYNGSQSTAVFDLDRLEQDVVKFYIAGKPLIAIDSSIRTVFRFRNSPTEDTLPRNNPGCATDISAIAQELPDDYKIPLEEETKKVFEFHFRTASYHTFTEIVNGLRTIMGHLIQDILQRKDKELNTKLLDYLRKFFKKDHKVFNEIGILSIDDAQCKLLGDVEMKRLFKCLGLFVGWLQGGLYDFSSLPISVFKHLKSEDVNIIMKSCSKYSPTEMEHLLIELDEFEKLLNHAENHLVTKEELQSRSITQCLVDLGFCESNDKLVTLIPKSILVCHYVHFRITLRKLKIQVKEMASPPAKDPSAGENKWTEFIEDLWKVHLPHFQDEVKVYDDNCLKFDCVYYGDDEESESDSETWLDKDIEDSVVEVSETKETEKEIIQKIKDDPKLKEAIMKTLVPDPTPSSASPSVTASSTPSLLTAAPSDKAMNMTSEELCQWLKGKSIADKYIEYFRKDDIDGSVLGEFNDDDLKGMGISEPHIRKKIMIQFRKIK